MSSPPIEKYTKARYKGKESKLNLEYNKTYYILAVTFSKGNKSKQFPITLRICELITNSEGKEELNLIGFCPFTSLNALISSWNF